MLELRVYTVPDCIDCAAVMFLLDEARIRYEEVDISELPQAREALAMLSGFMSVPQVFVGDTFVGQVAAVRHLLATGRLQRMVANGPKKEPT